MRALKFLLLGFVLAGLLFMPTMGQANGQTIVYGTTAKVDSLDPHAGYILNCIEYLRHAYPTLLAFKPGTTELVPDLALSWTSSADNKEWTFKLREDLKFPDGTPFDASVVKYSIDRVFKLESSPSWLVSAYVDHAEVVGPYEIKFVLQKPMGFFPYMLPHSIYIPVNPNVFPLDTTIDWPNDLPGGKTTGLGPYNITSFKRDEEAVFEVNPDYYGPRPKNDRIIIRFFADATTLRLALEKGEVDFAFTTLNPSDVEDLEQSGKYKVWKTASPYMRLLTFCTNIPPVDNVAVRQAVAAAIDRQPIIDKVYMGQMAPTYSFMIKEWAPYYIPAFETAYGAEGNLAKARELLASAGYDEDNKCKFELWYTPTALGDMEMDFATMVKTQLEATGVFEITLMSVEFATFWEKVGGGEMPAHLMGIVPDYVDPDFMAALTSGTGAEILGNFYNNEAWDAKIAEAGSIADVAKRKAIYDWLQEQWAKEVPELPLFQGFIIAVSAKNLEGLAWTPIGELRYENIHRVE